MFKGKCVFNSYYRNARRYCPYSRVLDETHNLELGSECTNRHEKHFWHATEESRYTIIGDSIVKNLNGFRYNDVQAYPGLRTGTLLAKLQLPDEIKLDYNIVVVAVGTNDLEDSTIQPENFVQLINNIVLDIWSKNPSCKIGISEILLRYKDNSQLLTKILNFNRSVKNIVRS